MAKKEKTDLRYVRIGTISAILGAMAGAITNGYITLYSDKEKLRLSSALESYKFDYGQYPIEFLDLKQLIDEMKSLSMLKPETISKIAGIIRDYPECGNVLSESCRPAMVKQILIMREEIGSGYASPEDIDIVLRDKYKKAQTAHEKLTQ